MSSRDYRRNGPEDDSHRRDQQTAVSATSGDLVGTHTYIYTLTGVCIHRVHKLSEDCEETSSK